jgi:ribosome biogenesis GTPase A
LKKVYTFFKDGLNEDIIPKELLEHKNQCDKYQAKSVKNVLVVANVSAGKSTLINALVGYRLNKMRTTACTSRLCYIYNKPVDDGTLAHNYIRNEFSYTNNIESVTSDTSDRISLKFNSTLYNEKVCLIDTPGINNIENSTHRKITEDAIKSNIYDAIIYISNCQLFLQQVFVLCIILQR